MPPGEFERHAGQGSAKKWKHTLRAAEGPHAGDSLGPWLVSYGLLPPNQPCAPCLVHSMAQFDAFTWATVRHWHVVTASADLECTPSTLVSTCV